MADITKDSYQKNFQVNSSDLLVLKIMIEQEIYPNWNKIA